MKVLFKRTLSLVLVLVTLVSIVPVSALAEGEAGELSALEGTIPEETSVSSSEETKTAETSKETTEPSEAPAESTEATAAPSEETAVPTETEPGKEPEIFTDEPVVKETEQSYAGAVYSAGIAVNEENFPDDVFRRYVASEFDTMTVVDDEIVSGADGYLCEEELTWAMVINVGGTGIKSLKGVELLPNIVTVWCSSNQISSLDLSKNTKLMALECDNNTITELDLHNNPELWSLRCGNNGLTKLDVRNCKKLVELWAPYNDLSSVDLRDCVALESLDLTENELTSLDISKNTALTNLRFGGKQLSTVRLKEEVDVSHLTLLEDLVFYYTDIERMDVSQNELLSYCYCPCNELTELVLGDHPYMESLICYQNDLTVLNLTGCTGLTTITAYQNQLTSLDVSNCTMLTNLYAPYNQYPIYLDENRNFDLKTLPGNFDVHKVVGWNSDETMITIPAGQGGCWYDYDCGNGFTVRFTLIVQEVVPTLEVGVMMGEEFVPWTKDKNGEYETMDLTSYGSYEVKAYLEVNGERTDVTADCDWSSSDENFVYLIAKIEDADEVASHLRIKTEKASSNQVQLDVAYSWGGYALTASCPIILKNLTVSPNEDLLQYAALSQLSYTYFSTADMGLTISQLLDKDISLSLRDDFLYEKEDYGATFASLYAAAVNDWTLVEQRNYSDGFSAVRFRNKDGCEVIAYRGTEPFIDGNVDILNDVALGLGNQASQLTHGVAFYDNVVKETGTKGSLVLTGHSLGGGIANYVSVLRNAEAVTFNAPSTMVSAIVSETKNFAQSFKGLNDGLRKDYINHKDWVGNTGVGDNPESTKYSNATLGQFTRNYTQTTKRGLLTTNKG